MDISLIIPAHNEESRLARTLDLYGDAFTRQFGSAYELIVVANGCRDQTYQVALEAARARPAIRAVNIAEKVGKGGAVLAGFRQACGRRVVFADADAATSPESLLLLLADLERHEVAIGSRRLPGSTILQRQPAARRALGWLFAATVRLLFGLPYRDTQCGAKAFRRDVACALAELVQERRWAFDVDLLLSARALDCAVIERPVVWSDQAGSKLDVSSTAWEIIAALGRLCRRYGAFVRQPARVYSEGA